jgi:hypothetical protein
MTRARRGELTARRHVRLPQRLSKSPVHFCPKLLYICEHAAGDRSHFSTPSPASPTRGGHCRTARMSSTICPSRIRLLIFVLSLLALLCRSSFIAVAARPPHCNQSHGRYFVNFTRPETIYGNTSLLLLPSSILTFWLSRSK